MLCNFLKSLAPKYQFINIVAEHELLAQKRKVARLGSGGENYMDLLWFARNCCHKYCTSVPSPAAQLHCYLFFTSLGLCAWDSSGV